MSNPNEPRRMTPRGNSADPREFDNTSGDAGRDGFTRIARRTPSSHPREDTLYGPGMSVLGVNDEINPQVGERDWNRGPRFSED